ncbi:MAG TPA: CC/Se motif family (seleno)protein [Symbiobacteriaceae bacterium]|nr:CC/Se motif family (seleno)protein [Symbiobacteriaceae bacterium]
MNVSFTPAAMAFLGEKGATEATISMLVFSSCCSGPLPPEVKPGAPADADGFSRHETAGVTIYYDSLLDELPEVVIDCKDFGSYKELFVQGWE